MDAKRYLDEPFVDSVLCVTGFSAARMHAFAHALTIAMNVRGEFILVEMGRPDGDRDWTRIPGVREILTRWGYLDPGSSRAAVFERLALRVSKVQVPDGDYRTALDLVAKHHVDLVVVGTEEQRPLVGSTASEKISRRSRTMTLFVPASGRGFVSLQDGHHILKNVLIPIDHSPSPGPAVTYAIRSAVFSTEDVVNLHLLHVGDQGPDVEVPADRPYLAFHRMRRKGSPGAEILKAASAVGADLIVMSTAASAGVLGALRGRISEQVVRAAPCPVLTVPLPV
jgi:nucleotide-binding universal stress UspA family protein